VLDMINYKNSVNLKEHLFGKIQKNCKYYKIIQKLLTFHA